MEMTIDRAGFFDGLREKREEVNPEVVALCKKWLLENFEKADTWNSNSGSYNLKHRAEKALGQYVSNGELIAAGIQTGFEYRKVGELNAMFKMKMRA